MQRIPIAITILYKEGKLVMHKRKFHPVGKLDMPGGFVEDNETTERAAVREAEEETGFTVKLMSKMGSYNYHDRGDKTMHVFIGEITGGELTNTDEGEPLWIDPKEINEEDLAFPQVHVQVIKDFLENHIPQPL